MKKGLLNVTNDQGNASQNHKDIAGDSETETLALCWL